jgi:hypothetical protein
MPLYEVQKAKYPHKYQVIVQDYKGGEKLVKFGHQDYQDYLQHQDNIKRSLASKLDLLNRRKNYLSRSEKIKDKQGKLTKDKRTSSNYYSRRLLWQSKEPFYDIPVFFIKRIRSSFKKLQK